MTDRTLPEHFRDLEPHLAWALPTEYERRAMRAASSMTDIRVFYDAMLPRLDEALTYLQQFPADTKQADVYCLFQLTTALAEIAPAIEMYGEQTADGMDVLRLTPIDIYPQRQ